MFLGSLPFFSLASATSISSARPRMDLRILLLVLALGISCGCNARVVTTDIHPEGNGIDSVVLSQQINLQQQQESEVDVVEELREIEQLCKLCQKIAVPVLKFLSDTSNQEKIKSTLGRSALYCPASRSCVMLKWKVFLEHSAYKLQVAAWTPKTFCITIRLCDLIPIPPNHLSEDSYESCRALVAEVPLKLKDPNTQLKTTEVLMKGCDVLEDFEGLAEKCKTLVYSYAPLILDNAEQFFKSYGVCSSAPNAIENVDPAFWI